MQLYRKYFPFNQFYDFPDPFIGKGLKEEGPNHNIANLLRILVEGNGNTILINASEYIHQSPIMYDPNIIEDENYLCELIGFSSHQSRENLSVKCYKQVTLRSTGERVRQIRTYNVVRDKKVVLKEIIALLDADSFAKLKSAGFIDSKTPYSDVYRYTISLEHLPIISPAWANAPVLRLDILLKNEVIISKLLCKARVHAKSKGIKLVSKDDFEQVVKSTGYPIYESWQAMVSKASKIFEEYEAVNSTITLKNFKYSKDDFTEDEKNDLVGNFRSLSNILRDVRFRTRCITMAIRKHNHAIHWQKIDTPPRHRPGTQIFEGQIYSLEDKRFITLVKKEWPETIYLYNLSSE